LEETKIVQFCQFWLVRITKYPNRDITAHAPGGIGKAWIYLEDRGLAEIVKLYRFGVGTWTQVALFVTRLLVSFLNSIWNFFTQFIYTR
jgi:hypothetical protein